MKNLCAGLLLLLSTTLAHADERATKQLAELLASMNTMQADFIHTVYAVGNERKVLQKSVGEVVLQRPNRFRWDIQKPEELLLLSDGTNLWTYDPELEQATVETVAERLQDTPALLLSGSTEQISQQFSVKTIQGNGGGTWFRLTPKNDSGFFDWVEMGFVDKKLTHMRLSDNLNQLSELEFDDIKLNPRLRSSTFEFKPPRGVDVIGTPK